MSILDLMKKDIGLSTKNAPGDPLQVQSCAGNRRASVSREQIERARKRLYLLVI